MIEVILEINQICFGYDFWWIENWEVKYIVGKRA